MPTLETYNGYPLWRYVPSLPAAIVFAILFGIATVLHGFMMVKNRSWFCLPFVVGGICKSSPHAYFAPELSYQHSNDS